MDILWDLEALQYDPATAELIRSGQTMGCFYIESPAMRSLFQRMDCECYEDVVAASSIIRPGVVESGMMKSYIERRRAIRSGKLEAGGEKLEVRSQKSEVRSEKEEFEIRNSKSETQNTKREIQHPKSETQNTKLEIRNSKSETQDPQCETENTTLEIQNPKSKMNSSFTPNWRSFSPRPTG